MFNIKHPQDPTKKYDIFPQIGIFKLGKIQSHVEELRKTGYKNQIEALEWSRIYMREYLHINIVGNNIKIILSTSSGPEALTCLFEVIYMVSFDHMEHIKSDLKFIKLVEFPG